jgi:hypothetical protein
MGKFFTSVCSAPRNKHTRPTWSRPSRCLANTQEEADISGEFVNDVRLAALERGRDAALQQAELTFQTSVAGGTDAIVAQATRQTTINATLASHTAAVAKLTLPPGQGPRR